MEESEGVLVRIIDEATITLRKDGIIQIYYNEGVEVNPALQDRVMKIFIEIAAGVKRPFLFSALEYVTVTKEARVHAIEMETIFPALASAVVAHNTHIVLLLIFISK